MSGVERWLPIAGYEGSYEVSDFGRVRSLDRILSDGHRRKGVTLALTTGSKGYLQVTLHVGSNQKTRHVHRLVLQAFGGSAPEGTEARHLNGIQADCAASNLAWGTHLKNMQDMHQHGTHKNSVKTHCPSGHLYLGDNLMVESNGNRRCVTCRHQSWLRVSARRSAERARVSQ